MKHLREVADAHDEIGNVGSASLRNAIAEGDQSRKAFYEQRFYEQRKAALCRHDRRFGQYGQSLAQWMREADRPLQDADIMARLTKECGASAESAGLFLDDAEYAGLLAKGPDGDCAMPIPPFAGHLLGEPLPDVSEVIAMPRRSRKRSSTVGPK